MDDPIRQVVARWHGVLEKGGEGLEALIADNCVFYSPVVFKPQRGKELTLMYLQAAAHVLGSDFHYTKEICDHRHAVLEFESVVNGKAINGVDIITCNSDQQIVEFKVMVRPLQAIQQVHKMMADMLKQLSGAPETAATASKL